MNPSEFAWMIYLIGAAGCTLATWWLFIKAWRFVRYSAVATVAILLFTPYAIDPQTMIMAPAIFTLAFDGMGQGFGFIKQLLKVMSGIWLIAIIIIAVYVLLTARKREPEPEPGAEFTASSRATRSLRNVRHTRKPARKRNFKLDKNKSKKSQQEPNSNLVEEENPESHEAPIRAIRD